MQRVTEDTLPRARAFLERRPELAMFPLSNLRRFGLDGPAPYAPRMWLSDSGVLTITRNGTVMPNCAPEDAASVLAGAHVLGVIGPQELCRPLIDMLCLNESALELDEDEPQFALDLNRLQVPDGRGRLVPLQQATKTEMITWRAAYCVETLGRDDAAAEQAGRQDYERYVQEDTHRVLMDNDMPLAMTGFNAQLPQIVQIGGVYTPPKLRSAGLARRAVALHLQQAQAAGVQHATLFAHGAAAQKAYKAIGFEQIGSWTILMRKQKGAVRQ